MWMELRCDNASAAVKGCRNEQGSTPMGAYGDTAAAVAFGRARLLEEAREAGWRRVPRRGWCCPRCLQAMEAQRHA